MAPRISIHVVFDTNAIHTKSADQLLRRDVSEQIKAPSKKSIDLHWYVPPIVLFEREYQMLEEAKTFLPHLRRADRFFGTSYAVTLDRTRARVKTLITECVKDHGIKVPEFNGPAVDLVKLVERAAFRLPPFEAGDDEKGFRDAIVLERFIQFHQKLRLRVPNQLALITDDRLLAQAATDRLGNSPVFVVHKSVEGLVTSLTALSADIDPNEARELVRSARSLWDKKVTVASLRKILFEECGPKLENSPSGERVSTWTITVGDIALLAKQAARLTFQTTVRVLSQTLQPVQNLPFIQLGDSSGFTATIGSTVAFPAAASDIRHTAAINFGGTAPTAGTAFSTVMPSSGPTVASSTAAFSGSQIAVLRVIGQHTVHVRWSATLSDKELNDFAIVEVDYEGVVWQ